MPAKEHRTTTGTPVVYDQSLIAQAPEITKADRQEGYDLNLVEQGHKTPQPPSRPRTVPPPVSGPLEKSATPPIPGTNGYSKYDAESKYVPWYRTTRGLAIVIVVAFVVVGIIVGVSVGVTQTKKNNSDPAPPQTSESTGGGGGAVPTPTQSAGAPTTTNPNASVSSPVETTSAATGGGSGGGGGGGGNK